MHDLEFSLESLETRMMLAGDVSVRLAGGDLRIDGDNDSNGIVLRVEQGGILSVAGGSDTLINGSDTPFLVDLDSMTDDLKINLKGGDDRLQIGRSGGGLFNVVDDVTIRMGSGDDQVWLYTLSGVGDDLNVRGDSGDDRIQVANVEADDKVSINAGSGFNTIDVAFVSAVDARISGGGGEDKVILQSTNFEDSLRVRLGGGEDTILSHSVMAGAARLSGGGAQDLWRDSDGDVGSRDLFSYADTGSLESAEVDENVLFDFIGDLRN